jgi:hypothetical protein
MGALEMLNCEPAISLRTKTARMRSRDNILHDTISGLSCPSKYAQYYTIQSFKNKNCT